MATGRDLVNMLMTQQGKRYVFGAEVSPSNPSPRAFDCSEIIEWGLARLGVRFPDGSLAQINACQSISVAQGLRTPGALLWKPGHIATSRGDNTTIEAKGRDFGVGVFSAVGRFTRAGLIIQLHYGADGKMFASPPPVDLVAIARGIEAAKRQTLRPGARGDAVRFLQVGINNISGRGLTVDGVFGGATTDAVKDLQRLLRLKVDGVVGPQTWRVIYP